MGSGLVHLDYWHILVHFCTKSTPLGQMVLSVWKLLAYFHTFGIVSWYIFDYKRLMPFSDISILLRGASSTYFLMHSGNLGHFSTFWYFVNFLAHCTFGTLTLAPNYAKSRHWMSAGTLDTLAGQFRESRELMNAQLLAAIMVLMVAVGKICAWRVH